MPRLFVTVGTTKFDKLIETVCSENIFKILNELGYNEIIIQRGSSKYPSENKFCDNYNITIYSYDYKPTLAEDIELADLVISHAGAGSLVENLEQKKKLIAVINDVLMDNHQSELAEQLQADGHLIACYPGNLDKALSKLPTYEFVPYIPGDPSLLNPYIEHILSTFGHS